MRFKFRYVFIAFGSLSAGCALHEVPPKAPVLPAAFDNRSIENQQPWPSQDWYKGFGSPELQALIDQAAGSNLDLTMARARVKQADARARQAHAAILPSVDANGNANYLAGHSVDGTAHETDWSALLSASYEVDFWGKNRATARSASLLAQASKADRDTIALTTLAGVANGYFQVLSLTDRLAIAAANVDAAQNLLAVIQARYDVGLSNPVELATQKTIVATAALVIPDLRQQQAEALAGLAILLGRAPENFSVEGRTLDTLSEPQVGSGLPSELLTRRPDLFMAEANMHAANADVIVARAALFPSLTLTASGGLQNPALNAAVISLSGAGPTLNLGAAIMQPIFNGGRLRAARNEAEAKEEELVAAYSAAILSALVDVENALAALRHLDDARLLQEENLAQSARAFEGASIRYKAGAHDYLALLEAQRTLYTAREQYSLYKLARLQALVALCKALGGGWQVQAPLSSTKEIR
jgi:NodT family efflux transporter outer membrane factor (OMF) lipoprotein